MVFQNKLTIENRKSKTVSLFLLVSLLIHIPLILIIDRFFPLRKISSRRPIIVEIIEHPLIKKTQPPDEAVFRSTVPSRVEEEVIKKGKPPSPPPSPPTSRLPEEMTGSDREPPPPKAITGYPERERGEKFNSDKRYRQIHPSWEDMAYHPPAEDGVEIPVNKKEARVSLNTRDFRYISYLGKVKRQIEMVWNYPLVAQQRGHQGKLLLEFTIYRDGSLMEVELLRSSGYRELDEEAIKAIEQASPYYPFPRSWNELERLSIVGSFEYILSYTFIQ